MFGLAGRAHGYQYSAGRFAARMYDRVAADVAAAGLPDGGRVLDVGTGPGLVPLRIAAACPGLRIDAIDLAPEMIEQARRNAVAASVPSAGSSSVATFSVGDVAQMSFPDDSFDLVVSSISQHHWADPQAGLREICRVLRPGAQAWIYDFRFLALNRAQRAARGLDSGVSVSRQSPLPGASRFSVIGRLVLVNR
jgi:ubiquinone/menaquinone biosynthesis C-methylase UbiE